MVDPSLLKRLATLPAALAALACSGNVAIAGQTDGSEETAEEEVEADTVPVCGNGIVEIDEPCDDGNIAPWDGCDECTVSEFQVNTRTAGKQWNPTVAMGKDSTLVIAWRGLDEEGWGVFGQRYHPDGQPAGSEFQVNSYAAENQRNPSVALSGTGDFVIVWMSHRQDGDGWGIFGQRYTSDGLEAGAEFQVNSTTAGDQQYPDITVSDDGCFVVVWVSVGQDGDGLGLYGQRFDSAGTSLGPEFLVNRTTAGNQSAQDVALAPDGRFAIVWQSWDPESGSSEINMRRYRASGTPQGGEIVIDPLSASYQVNPSIGAIPDGRFVVAWGEIDETFRGDDRVAYQIFESTGAPLGSARSVSEEAGIDRSDATVAPLDEGFVVAWQSDGEDGDSTGIFTRLFDDGGEPTAPDFQANVFTAGMQWNVSSSMSGDGRFVLVWVSDGQDGDEYGVFAQRYSAEGSPRGLSPWE